MAAFILKCGITILHGNFMSIFLSLSERSIMICSAEGNMLTCLRAKTNVKNEAENSCEESIKKHWVALNAIYLEFRDCVMRG